MSEDCRRRWRDLLVIEHAVPEKTDRVRCAGSADCDLVRKQVVMDSDYLLARRVHPGFHVAGSAGRLLSYWRSKSGLKGYNPKLASALKLPKPTAIELAAHLPLVHL